jgi:hypothetical protein
MYLKDDKYSRRMDNMVQQRYFQRHLLVIYKGRDIPKSEHVKKELGLKKEIEADRDPDDNHLLTLFSQTNGRRASGRIRATAAPEGGSIDWKYLCEIDQLWTIYK